MLMKLLPKVFILVAILFSTGSLALGQANFGGQVTIGSAIGEQNSQVVVSINLSGNNIEIAVLTIPIQFGSSDLTVDSVSFVGTLLKTNMAPLVMIDNDARTVRITYVPISGQPVITEASGLLGRIFFSISPTAIDQIVAVDSVYSVQQFGSVEVWTRIEFADWDAQLYFASGVSGGTVSIETVLDADDDQFTLPSVLSLRQNFPNPFNPSTKITFSLPTYSEVSLKIYNILGQEIATLVEGQMPAGEYEYEWSSLTAASGIYFYRLRYQDQVLTKKMTLLK